MEIVSGAAAAVAAAAASLFLPLHLHIRGHLRRRRRRRPRHNSRGWTTLYTTTGALGGGECCLLLQGLPFSCEKVVADGNEKERRLFVVVVVGIPGVNAHECS